MPKKHTASKSKKSNTRKKGCNKANRDLDQKGGSRHISNRAPWMTLVWQMTAITIRAAYDYRSILWNFLGKLGTTILRTIQAIWNSHHH